MKTSTAQTDDDESYFVDHPFSSPAAFLLSEAASLVANLEAFGSL